MIKKYEDACREAGLSEETIREIRKLFDADKKRLRRRINSKEQKHLQFVSLSTLKQYIEISDEWDIPDPDSNAEEIAIHNYLLEQLEFELSKLDDNDRELILMCFDPSVSISEYSKKMNIPRQTINSRRDQIVEKLKKKFLVKEKCCSVLARHRNQKKRGQNDE